MPDLTNQQFYDVTFAEEPRQKQPWYKKRLVKQMAVALAILAVIIIGVVVAVKLISNQQAENRQEQALTDQINGRIEEEAAACQDEIDKVACENEVRSRLAQTLGRVSACEGLDTENYKNCVTLIAFNQQDESLCKALLGTERSDCTDLVVSAYAVENLDLKACNRVKNTDSQQACLQNIQNTIISQGRCSQFNLDQNLCDDQSKISTTGATGNPADCEKLAGALKDECLTYIYSTDADGDGLMLVEEFKAGTSDNDPDTDNDSVNDFGEIYYYGTDPLNPDTDGDGYDDGTEILNGYDPLK